jgi:hypothetical protein
LLARTDIIAMTVLVLAFSVFGCTTGSGKDSVPGHYTWGHEVNTFQPCSTDKVYWVSAAGPTMEGLKRSHRELTTQPYESVFVRVSGKSATVPASYRDGFAGDYDGVFIIEEVYEIRRRRDSDCKTTERPGTAD